MVAAMSTTPGMQLSTLLANVVVRAVSPASWQEIIVHGLAIDSRNVVPGDCFFALPGTRVHGQKFAAEAIARGAVAVVADATDAALAVSTPLVMVESLAAQLGPIAAQFYAAPSRALDVSAVTGTNGKTTVAHLITQAWDYLGESAAYIGTLGAGTRGSLAETQLTTPDAISLQRYFAEFRARGIKKVAIEASSHGLAQSRLRGSDIDCAIYTGLGHDHLDYHRDLDAYFNAKRSLFKSPGLKHAMVNCDDGRSEALIASLAADARVWRYGIGPRAASDSSDYVWARKLRSGNTSTCIDVTTSCGNGAVEVQLLGAFNVQNVLACLADLLAFGVGIERGLATLAFLQPVVGRVQMFGGNGVLPRVVVDYAHSPDSLENVLQTLRALEHEQLICVFGCGGDRDRAKRAPMGALAERYADRIVLTADNPRSESNSAIVHEILAGVRAPAKVGVEHDRERAISAAVASASPRDIVLIAGKGHEREQLIGEQRTSFSDADVVRRALASYGRD